MSEFQDPIEPAFKQLDPIYFGAAPASLCAVTQDQGNDILEGDDDDVTRTPASAHGSDTMWGDDGEDGHHQGATKLIAYCAYSMRAMDLFCSQSLGVARTSSGPLCRCIKLQQTRRRNPKGLGQATDIDQGSVALSTFNTSQIASACPGFQWNPNFPVTRSTGGGATEQPGKTLIFVEKVLKPTK